MKTAALLEKDPSIAPGIPAEDGNSPKIEDLVEQAWSKMAPFWPLENLIAVNPLQGFEDLPFEQALEEGNAFFRQKELPDGMAEVNRHTIKWCQAFFDEGQATVTMPFRKAGLWAAWRELARHDDQLMANRTETNWLKGLPDSAEAAIAECLSRLRVRSQDRELYLTLLLATLPGWAAYLKYRTDWSGAEPMQRHPASQADYLAMRLTLICLLWPEGANLLAWHARCRSDGDATTVGIGEIQEAEEKYRGPLLAELSSAAANTEHAGKTPDAQLVFCIDVRSEPFRRALEQQGNYDTLGFAGFFGIPVRIDDEASEDSYASCPVLLQPKHTVIEKPCGHTNAAERDREGFERVRGVKRLYQSVKYAFTTPFVLVETLGPLNGLWMALRSFAPGLAARAKRSAAESLRPSLPVAPLLTDISLDDQCQYAEDALRMMGLTDGFAPLVVLCGHGSTTQNNAYATALDCGACGGRHGASNARILATILNEAKVRAHLDGVGISIPEDTLFIAGQHDTTTDSVELFVHGVEGDGKKSQLDRLSADLEAARNANSVWRAGQLGEDATLQAAARLTEERSLDWAQVRPEWGLARNAAFIVAPRSLTEPVNLDGRSFLHSYDWRQDPTGASLTVILTAPMVVAQWINSQYLFSTLDNVAYGGGSKVTKNIVGKVGIMQGNASDLMHGLPLQSVFQSDADAYHEPMRLMTVVYAPRGFIDGIIEAQDVLKQLFGNGWVTLACIDPDDNRPYLLTRDLTWEPAS